MGADIMKNKLTLLKIVFNRVVIGIRIVARNFVSHESRFLSENESI